MNITIILLVLGLMLMAILFLTYLIKYKSLYKETTDIITNLNKPLRKGYFKITLQYYPNGVSDKTTPPEDFFPYIYITEKDRYTDGTCLVEIDRIEPGIPESKIPREIIVKWVRDAFHSTRKISEITWLESESKIKEMRKNKLEQLKSVISGKKLV